MYYDWWFLIWLTDAIDVLKLVVSDITETASLGQQMLELSCENATLGVNGLTRIYPDCFILCVLNIY